MMDINYKTLRKFMKNEKPFFLLVEYRDSRMWMLMEESIELIETYYEINFLHINAREEKNFAEFCNLFNIRPSEERLPAAIYFDGSSYFFCSTYKSLPQIENLLKDYYKPDLAPDYVRQK